MSNKEVIRLLAGIIAVGATGYACLLWFGNLWEIYNSPDYGDIPFEHKAWLIGVTIVATIAWYFVFRPPIDNN